MKLFKEKFRIDELLIKRIGNWDISLRPAQVTIGSLVLSLNRECSTLGQMTAEETKELATVFQFVETLYSKTFQPPKVNYLALMMVDHQVHFHVIPRYEQVVNFQRQEYKDLSWPRPVNVLKTLEMSSVALVALHSFFLSK